MEQTNNLPATNKYLIERPKLIQEFESFLRGDEQLLLIDANKTHGSGKTTLLDQLHSKMEQQNQYLPIKRFSIRETLEPAKSLKSEIDRFLIILDELGKEAQAAIDGPDFSDFKSVFTERIAKLERSSKTSFQKQQRTKGNNENEVFVSYAWGGESENIVNKLEEAFSKNGIHLIRDKSDTDYKDSIKEFEQRIGAGECIILVISDKYLRSEHCMYELMEVDKNQNLRERIFPIVLADAQIYRSVERIKYARYWEEQAKELQKEMRLGSISNLPDAYADLNLYEHIRANFDHLTNFIRNMNTLTPEFLADNDYSILIDAVKRAIAESKADPIRSGNVAALIDEMIGDFERRLKLRPGGRRLIFFIDDFSYIIDEQIGTWFQVLLQRLKNLTFVIARVPSTYQNIKKHSFPPGTIKELTLTPFSQEEIQAYLQKRFENVFDQHERRADLMSLAKSIHVFSDGHPGTVSLGVDTIRPDELSDIASLVEFFEGLTQKFNQGSHTPVEKMKVSNLKKGYDALLDGIFEDLRERNNEAVETALHIGSVVLRFDDDLLKTLMQDLKPQLAALAGKDEDEQEAFYNSAVKWLKGYSFVQELNKDQNDESEEPVPVYTFQNFVRDILEEKLREQTNLYNSIHKHASDYYRKKLLNPMNSRASFKAAYAQATYLKLFTLEESSWQEWVIQFLYHESFNKDENPNKIRLSFVRWYFSAFDWWESYLPSPLRFCDRLLELWEKIANGEDDKSVMNDLRTFAQEYPKEYYYRRHGKGNWRQSRHSLLNIRMMLGIADKPDTKEQLGENDEFKKNIRNAYGLTGWFIAQSYQYGSPSNFSAAEENYYEAREMFVYTQHVWNLLWADMYLADLYLENGDYQTAIVKAELSLKNATTETFSPFSERDHEVICQNYRILGDAYWFLERLDLSFQFYAKAIFHGYIYNGYPETQRPDIYTETHYKDTCLHVTNKISDLWQKGKKEQALAAIDFLHENWELYWKDQPEKAIEINPVNMLEQKQITELSNYLFPAPPNGGDRERVGDYVRELRGIAQDMRKPIEMLGPAPIPV